MAGRNVAPDLSGMFGQINEAIASDKTSSIYTDNFKRSMAPPIDMDDSESILRYSQWAKRNGYEEEARSYMALGYKQRERETQLAKDKTRAEVMADGYRRGSTAKGLAGKGDVRALTLNREALQAQLDAAKEAGDPELVRNIAATMAGIDAELPGAQTEKAKRGAAAIDTYRGWLEDMPETDPRRKNLEKALAYLEADSEVQAAYRDLQKDKLSVESAENNVIIQEDTIEANEYARGRRPYDEMVDELEVELKQWNLVRAQQSAEAAEAVAADKAADTAGKELSRGLASQGIYDPSRIPEDTDATVRAYAVKYLNDERNAKEQADSFAAANSKKMLTPYYLNEALNAAYVNPDAPPEKREVKNAKFAQLLQEYERILNSGDGTMIPTQLAPYTSQIVGAIKERDAKQLANIGNMDIAAASALQGFRLMPSTKGIFESHSFHSLMDDSIKGQARFIEMKTGLTEYMADNGIEGFANVAELYAAMEDIAPTLSDPAWHKASNQGDLARKSGQQRFNRRMAEREAIVVEQYVAQALAEDPSQSIYKDIIEDQGREKFDSAVGQIYDFFTVDNRWWMTNKGGLERDPETGLRLTPQMRMIMNSSEGSEWDAVKEMLGEDLAATVEARVMSGIPVRFEDLVYEEKEKKSADEGEGE